MKNIFPLLVTMIFISACASSNTIPIEIRQDITDSKLSIDTVRGNISEYEGQIVRWGGKIASIENKASETWIEVVGSELDYTGRPVRLDDSHGRFIVKINGFLDPAVFMPERGLTIYGIVESEIIRTIDEYPYSYPLIAAKSFYLWSDYQLRRRHYAYHYPYRYYPYYPYRFYYPYYFRFGIGHHFGHHYW